MENQTTITEKDFVEIEKIMDTDFRKDLASLINLHSLENLSNTPDFILADHLINSLKAFCQSVNRRQAWHG